MTHHDSKLLPEADRVRRSRISWRKQLLLHRVVLLQAWRVHFPVHDFHDLRPIPKPLPRESGHDRDRAVPG